MTGRTNVPMGQPA